MTVNYAELEIMAVKAASFPATGMPEIAFAGKSNVGKSSLINATCARKALARTSSNPGKTRTINFYNIEKSFYFVDLPGYGYAKVSKAEREKWGQMIEGYLKNRHTLRAVALLIDIRHQPSENDCLMLEWLRYYQCPFFIVATKSDKIKRSQHQKQTALIKKTLNLTEADKLLLFSAQDKKAVPEMWAIIEGYLSPSGGE